MTKVEVGVGAAVGHGVDALVVYQGLLIFETEKRERGRRGLFDGLVYSIFQ